MQSITADNGAALAAYQLEPQLITALSEDKNRTKRRLVTYKEIPPQMVQAVIAIEDRRFFEHGGINYARTREVRGAGHSCGPQGLRRVHADAAAGARILPDAGQDDLAQDCGVDDHVPAGGALHQAADLRDVCERDEPGAAREL